MGFALVAYPFLFVSIFFETFLLVTFLSEPARLSRKKRPVLGYTPTVAVIVPCFNEENTIQGTIDSLLALDYPKEKLSIVLVDDGSTDNTANVMDSYKDTPHITIIHKENGGKHTAVNAGIHISAQAEFVGCLDADSFVAPDALREMVGYFEDPQVAAVTAAMSIHEPKKFIEHMQNIEYIYGIAHRHTMASVNGLYVTPGPFSFYRRKIIVDLGYFKKAHNTEDLEMALRLQRAGYLIENAPRARVYTKGPKTIRGLVKQRTRWTTGFVRNVMYEYSDLIGNPKFGTLGILVLPLGLISIISGLALFCLAIYQFIQSITSEYFLTRGIPLSYTLTPHIHTIEWFYIPITAVVLLGSVAVIGSIVFTILGQQISKTPGKLFAGIVAYTIVYGFISPLWLMRTVYDVTTGVRRSWR